MLRNTKEIRKGIISVRKNTKLFCKGKGRLGQDHGQVAQSKNKW